MCKRERVCVCVRERERERERAWHHRDVWLQIQCEVFERLKVAKLRCDAKRVQLLFGLGAPHPFRPPDPNPALLSTLDVG